MKILLLGEFSALHKNLKEGLLELGHDVTIASSGDTWKKIDKDIDLSMNGSGVFSQIKYRFKFFYILSTFKKFDVVQLINPSILEKKWFPSKLALYLLKKNNKTLFLLAAGDDSYYWRFGRKALRYGPFDDYLKYDLKKDKDPRESRHSYLFNKYVVNTVTAVIPIMYEYEVSYQDSLKTVPVIPIPINVNKIKYSKNLLNGQLVVFHGLNRYGFKGTHHIEKAFEILEEKHPNVLKLIIRGRMPLDEYLKLMQRANVVIDQTSSYSLGVNGIYALAMGKVVLGGAEPESLVSLNVRTSPVINILPEVNDIVSKVEYVLENLEKLEYLGREGREFAENVHCYKLIAKKYLEQWSYYLRQ